MLEPLGKATNVGLHRRMPETFEMESVHFPKSLFGRPSFECNAVSRDKYTGAITAQPAMHKNFVAGPPANQREEICDLFVGWRRPAVPWNADKVHAARFRVGAFCFHRAVKFAAQVNKGVYTELLQFVHTLEIWLCSAIEKVVQFAGVGDPMDVNSFRESRLRRG